MGCGKKKSGRKSKGVMTNAGSKGEFAKLVRKARL